MSDNESNTCEVIPVGCRFLIRVTHEPGSELLALEGELDLASAPILEAELDRLERLGPIGIVLDLRRLSFMDVAGMRVLLAVHQRAHDADLKLTIVRGPRAVQCLLELAGVAQVLGLVDGAGPEPAGRLPASRHA